MKRPGSDFFYFYSIMKKNYKKKVWRIKMQSAAELKSLLNRIDHKGYPAYKDTKGIYQFQGYELSIVNQAGIIARDLRISLIIATKKLLRSMK